MKKIIIILFFIIFSGCAMSNYMIVQKVKQCRKLGLGFELEYNPFTHNVVGVVCKEVGPVGNIRYD